MCDRSFDDQKAQPYQKEDVSGSPLSSFTYKLIIADLSSKYVRLVAFLLKSVFKRCSGLDNHSLSSFIKNDEYLQQQNNLG